MITRPPCRSPSLLSNDAVLLAPDVAGDAWARAAIDRDSSIQVQSNRISSGQIGSCLTRTVVAAKIAFASAGAALGRPIS